MSIFKTNKFFRVIKHFILALPLMFILGVSLYTIVNPNAKDSYYGDTINEVEYYNVESKNDLVPYTRYRFSMVSAYNTVSFMGSDTNRIYVEDVNIISTSATNDFSDLASISFSYRTVNYYNVSFFDSDNNLIVTIHNDNSSFIADLTYISNTLSTQNIFNYAYVFDEIVYNDYSYLSNSFEYGMFKFSELGFNNFDFVGLFNGIFIDQPSNVYCKFINSYINYYLMIECVYFVPWVIHFFIHIAYDLGDRFINFRRDKKEDD